MKNSIIHTTLLIYCLFTSFIVAGEYRSWTESTTKRTVKGRIIDKSLDDKKARLARPNGTSFWIETNKLTRTDREYIMKWVKPIKYLSARVTASGRDVKTVKVDAFAGTRDLVIKAYYNGSKSQPQGYPKIHKLKKGESKSFTYKGGNKYTIKAFDNGKMVAEVSWRKKTGK